MQVLNIKHKLHVRKILISRDKLKPMSQQEKKMMQAVEIEVRTHFHLIGPLVYVCMYVCMYVQYVKTLIINVSKCDFTGFRRPNAQGTRRAQHRHSIQSGQKRPRETSRGVFESR